MCFQNLKVNYGKQNHRELSLKKKLSDLLFPDGITVEGFAPCGLFYTSIQQMTFFFPLWTARHSLWFASGARVKKLESDGNGS